MMKTEKITIKCPDGKPLKGLIWGNNAAWICKCDELCGNRTGDTECIVFCECGCVYEIQRGLNKNNNPNLAKATGVNFLRSREQK